MYYADVYNGNISYEFHTPRILNCTMAAEFERTVRVSSNSAARVPEYNEILGI